MPDTGKTPFSRDDHAKQARLLEVRARLAAATPIVSPRKRLRVPVDWRRSLRAWALILLLLAVMVLGSGVLAA